MAFSVGPGASAQWRPPGEIWEGDPSITRSGQDRGFGLDVDAIGSRHHLLSHFNSNSNSNTDMNLIEYKYKMNHSNLDSNLDILLISNIVSSSRVPIYFVNDSVVDRNHYTSRE